jgi:hypothetical protein
MFRKLFKNRRIAELTPVSSLTKNKQIGITIVGEIRNAGGTILPDSPTNLGNPFHCQICGLTGDEFEKIFIQRVNPVGP